MRRLLPIDPHAQYRSVEVAPELTVAEAYGSFLGARGDRPWIALCMVASIDGSTVLDGASGGLSSSNDSAILSQLRHIADVIVVGAGTARAEGYGPPRKPGQRIGLVTASGRVDRASPLFASGAGFLITTESAPVPPGVDAVRAGDDRVDLTAALSRLGEVCDTARFVQCEGGPTLNAALLDADLIDEINLTTSPLAVGGAGPRATNGAGDHTATFALAQLAADDESFLYARWLRQRRRDG